MTDFFICDCPHLYKFEHVASISVRMTHILILICIRINFFQMLGVVHKLFAQPFRRDIFVSAPADQRLRILKLRLLHILIRPVYFTARRVKGFKAVCLITASDGGLLNTSDLFRSRKLIQLLQPENTDISELRLNRFNFQRIIRPAEIYLLAGWHIRDFKRGCLKPKLLFQSQLRDRPFHLSEHRIFYRIPHLAENQRVHTWMILYQLRNYTRNSRGLGRTTPTGKNIFCMLSTSHIANQRMEYIRNHIQINVVFPRCPGFLFCLAKRFLLLLDG